LQNKNSDNQATDAQLKQELIRHSHGVFRAGSAADLQKACARLILAMQELCRLGGVDWQTVEKLVADGIERNNQRVGGFFQGGPEELSRLLKNSPEQVPEIILSDENRLVPLIKSEMQAAVEVDMAVAFVSRAGFNLLVKPLAEMAEGGRKIRFLTSTMNELNRPEDLKYIAGLFPEQMQLKVFYPPNQETGQPDYRTDPPSFHVKSFLFHKLMGENSLLIGSSNMTGAGLAGNVEWNYFSNSEVNLPWGEKSIFDKALQQYNEYWEKQSVDALDENFMAAYEQKYLRRQTEKTFVQAGAEKALLSPRTAQNEALKVLSAKRLAGITKTAVVAATGLGKTFLAAFDFQNSGLKNVLFIVHRENILLQSMETYRRVTGNNNFRWRTAGKQQHVCYGADP
jgi:HKD family nuclease